MRTSIKIWSVAGLLGLGLVTALLFRREQPPAKPVSPMDQLLILRGDRGHVPQRRKRPLLEPMSEAMAPVQAAVAAPRTAPDQPPPELPSVYRPSLLPISEAMPKHSDRLPAEKKRTHKIVDGDTLTRLAQRYLGDGARYLEIFEANSDQLKTPDVLPIGAVIKIPARDSLPLKPKAQPSKKQADPVTPAPAEPKAAESPAEPVLRDLVPIPRDVFPKK